MSCTGLFFLPILPNTSSPSSALISHINRKFSAQPLAPFSLDHRLLVDTSSLLPGSDQAQRRYTQFLTLAHVPGQTHIGTSTNYRDDSTSPETGAMSIIAIPGGQATDDCFEIILRKMQPLWAPRQSLRVDSGVALKLKGGQWKVRIGDVRITSRQGQGNIRGAIVELECYEGGSGDEKDDEKSTDWGSRDLMMRAFFEALTGESGVSTNGMRVVIKVPGVGNAERMNLTLVRQYMELLRFARTS